MPYEHGRKSGIVEKFAYGRNHSFCRRSVDQGTNKSCPKDLQLPQLPPTGPRLPLFTVIFVDTDAFRKASCPLLPDIVENKGFESESTTRMDGHERPSPQLFMVGLQAANTDFTRLYSSCIYSEASSSDQSMNKTPSPLISPSTPLPCHSTSGNSSGSVCDSGTGVGTDSLVNDFPKVEKRVKRNPRKKGKKKGKQYKRIASRKVSTESDVQCNGKTYSASTFEASNPSSLSSSGKHHFDNNLSDETAPSSLLDNDITLDKDDCSNNIKFVDCPNLFSSTSYSDEMEEVPSPQRFAGDESGCNTATSLHSSCTVDDAEAVPFTSNGSSREHRFKKNNIRDGNFPDISVDKSLDCWNSDTGGNSSDEVATRLLVKDESGPSSSEGEIVPPSEEVIQHDPSSSQITMDLHNLDIEIPKDCYNNDSFLSNSVLDVCSSTERADSNDQVGSSNDFQPVISGRRGRRSRRMINNGSSTGTNRYTTTNVHSHTAKDNYSIWQKVQKFENKESISKPNDVSVLPPHREVPLKDTKMKMKNNKLVGVKQKQSGTTCRYSCSDATSKLQPSEVASKGPKTGRNPPKSTDGNSMNGERGKSNSGVKHANQYHQSGLYTCKSDMCHSSQHHFQQKEDLQDSSCMHLDNHSNAGLQSPSDNLSQRCLSKMSDSIDCHLTEPEKEIDVLVEEETPAENAYNGACHSSLPASCFEISPLPMTMGQFDQREDETNYENDKTKYTKDIQEGHSSVDSEDQQLNRPDFESYKEPNSLTSFRTSVQRWVPVGRKDSAVSVNNEAAVSQLTSGVAEVEDLSSNNLPSSCKDGEVSCPGANKMTNKLTSYPSSEVLDGTVNDQTCEMKEKKYIGLDTHLDKIIGSVNDACKFRAIVEGAQMVNGSPVADFEEFLFSASPVIQQTQCSRTCNSCSREQLIGERLCWHQIPNISLKHFWQWYEEPGCFGLEVKAHDSCNSRRLWNGYFGFTAYFVPYLSAVQLFKLSSSNRDCNLSGQPAVSYHMDRRAKSLSSLGSLPTLSMIPPQNCKVRNVCMSEFSSSSQEDLSDRSNHVAQEELIFEYFESEQPPRRRPLYDKIKELVNSSTLNDGCVFGDPSQLESVELHDLHPASWYCVAWYPIYRIPDGSFHAAFLTYHSLGHFVHQSAPRSAPGASKSLVSPVVGLQTYNDKGENWFHPRDSDSKVVHSEDASYYNTAELTKERLRTLKQTASVMARAVVCKDNRKSVNRHPDYEFFISRSW